MSFSGLTDTVYSMTTLTPEIVVSDGSTTHYSLSPRDRSDCCWTEPLYRVTIKNDLPDLMFCGHHFRKHEEALNIAVKIVDESSKIA